MNPPASAPLELSPTEQAAAIELWRAARAFWETPATPSDTFLRQAKVIHDAWHEQAHAPRPQSTSAAAPSVSAGASSAPTTYRELPAGFDIRNIKAWLSEDLAAWQDWCTHGPVSSRLAVQAYQYAAEANWLPGVDAVWASPWAQADRKKMVSAATTRPRWANTIDTATHLLAQWRPALSDKVYRTTLDRLLTHVTHLDVFTALEPFFPSKWKPDDLEGTIRSLCLQGTPHWYTRYFKHDKWKETWAWMPDAAARLMDSGVRMPWDTAFRAVQDIEKSSALVERFLAQPKGTYTSLELALFGTALGVCALTSAEHERIVRTLIGWGMPWEVTSVALEEVRKIHPFDGEKMGYAQDFRSDLRSHYTTQPGPYGEASHISWEVAPFMCSREGSIKAARSWCEALVLNDCVPAATASSRPKVRV